MRHHFTPFHPLPCVGQLFRGILSVSLSVVLVSFLPCAGFTQDCPKGLWTSVRFTGLYVTDIHSVLLLWLYLCSDPLCFRAPCCVSFPSSRLALCYSLLQHWLLSGEHNCVCKCLSLDSCCTAELYCVSVVTPCWYWFWYSLDKKQRTVLDWKLRNHGHFGWQSLSLKGLIVQQEEIPGGGDHDWWCSELDVIWADGGPSCSWQLGNPKSPWDGRYREFDFETGPDVVWRLHPSGHKHCIWIGLDM